MKTFESKNPQNEETKKNQPTSQPKTPQPGDNPLDTPKDPGDTQDPNKQIAPANTGQNPQIPTKTLQPQEDPMRKPPHVNPEPTPDEKRTDPYASKVQPEKKDSPNPNDLKEQKDLDAYPGTGKTRDTSVNEATTHKPTNINPSTERNRDKGSIDRDNARK